MQEDTRKAIEDIALRLKDKGERFTAPRRKTLEVLLQHGQAAKAYDIVDMIGGDVKPMTVYRALDFLTAQGLVHRIESLNAYAPCVESQCERHDSQYLICDSCDKIEELHNHKVDDMLENEVAKSGFQPSSKTIEIHGTCKDCI